MKAARILLTAGIAAYAAVAAANGLDRMSRATPGLERSVPGPFRAQADRSAALTQLARQNPSPALDEARAAVASDPINPHASALLGAALLQSGDYDSAAEAFRVAARFGWRNLATQGYWYQAALDAGDYEVAADRADAILRAHPRFAEEPELLRPMEEHPTGRAVLAERLAHGPGWLEPYLTPAADAPTETIALRYGVLSLVDPARRRFGCAAVAPFVAALVERVRRSDAQSMWNAHCPEHRVTGYLADPGFDEVLSTVGANFPLSWKLLPSGDVSIQTVEDRRDRSLRVANSASSSRMIMRQLTAFPPGLYRFRARSPEKAAPGSPRLLMSWTCGVHMPFPRRVEGDVLAEGQLLEVQPCNRQQLGVWLRGNETGLTISHIEFEKLR
jgi:tetratricopeptide (TPR) repeat protein